MKTLTLDEKQKIEKDRLMEIKLEAKINDIVKNMDKHDEVARLRAITFKEIYGVSTFNEVVKLFEEDYNKYKNRGLNKLIQLYKDYNYAIFFMYSPSSIRNNLVKFKNIIKKNGGKYEAMARDIFTLDNVYKPIKNRDIEIKKKLKEELRAKENDNNDAGDNLQEQTINRIKNIKRLLDEDKIHPKSRNQSKEQVRAYYIVIMIGLATGRRFSELIKTLTIKNYKGNIYFEGLLKGNDKRIEANIIELNYKDVKKYLKELRETLKSDDIKNVSDVNRKYGKVFNSAVKRLYKYDNVKQLRHIYSIIGATLFKKDNENVEDTITRILGHREVFTSALNYSRK